MNLFEAKRLLEKNGFVLENALELEDGFNDWCMKLEHILQDKHDFTDSEISRFSRDFERYFHMGYDIDKAVNVLVKRKYAEQAELAIDDKYSKEATLDEIEDKILAEFGEKPKVSTDARDDLIWIEAPDFTIIGYYQYDMDTGVTHVSPQEIKFKKETSEVDRYYDDPVYGKAANR